MSRLVDKVEQTKAFNLENSNLKLIGNRVRLHSQLNMWQLFKSTNAQCSLLRNKRSSTNQEGTNCYSGKYWV